MGKSKKSPAKATKVSKVTKPNDANTTSVDDSNTTSVESLDATNMEKQATKLLKQGHRWYWIDNYEKALVPLQQYVELKKQMEGGLDDDDKAPFMIHCCEKAIEGKRKIKEIKIQEKEKAQEIKRKKDCFKKIQAELTTRFSKESDFDIYQSTDHHQFQSVTFSEGCKICGDTKQVEAKPYCGLETCPDCRGDRSSGCIVCDWIQGNYEPCAGVDGDYDCYPRSRIVPDRKPSEDYYNAHNQPICHYCNDDIPKSKRRLGYSKQLEAQLRKQKKEEEESALQKRKGRAQRMADMTETEKAELLEAWKKKRPLLKSPCVVCRCDCLCCCMTGYCFSCWTNTLFNPDEWFE